MPLPTPGQRRQVPECFLLLLAARRSCVRARPGIPESASGRRATLPEIPSRPASRAGPPPRARSPSLKTPSAPQANSRSLLRTDYGWVSRAAAERAQLRPMFALRFFATARDAAYRQPQGQRARGPAPASTSSRSGVPETMLEHLGWAEDALMVRYGRSASKDVILHVRSFHRQGARSGSAPARANGASHDRASAIAFLDSTDTWTRH